MVDDDADDTLDDGALDNDLNDPSFSEERSQPQSKRKKRNKNTTNADDEAADIASGANLHPDDPQNFLKLCGALCILVSKSITEPEIDEADSLIRQYCLELVQVWVFLGAFCMDLTKV